MTLNSSRFNNPAILYYIKHLSICCLLSIISYINCNVLPLRADMYEGFQAISDRNP